MNCTICLEKYNSFELLQILECGHAYHYSCINKNESIRCPICRNIILDKISIIYSEDFNDDFFNWDSDTFFRNAEFLKENKKYINFLEHYEDIKSKIENMEKINEVSAMYFKQKIPMIKFSILKAIREGRKFFDVLHVYYSSEFEGYKESFLLKDRYVIYKNYSNNVNFCTFLELLQEYFPEYSFVVTQDRVATSCVLKVYGL